MKKVLLASFAIIIGITSVGSAHATPSPAHSQQDNSGYGDGEESRPAFRDNSATGGFGGGSAVLSPEEIEELRIAREAETIEPAVYAPFQDNIAYTLNPTLPGNLLVDDSAIENFAEQLKKCNWLNDFSGNCIAKEAGYYVLIEQARDEASGELDIKNLHTRLAQKLDAPLVVVVKHHYWSKYISDIIPIDRQSSTKSDKQILLFADNMEVAKDLYDYMVKDAQGLDPKPGTPALASKQIAEELNEDNTDYAQEKDITNDKVNGDDFRPLGIIIGGIAFLGVVSLVIFGVRKSMS